MGRRLGSKVKSSRRYGVALHPKAEKALIKRNYPPGVHGIKGRTRPTGYGLQLAEKQKAKIVYGILERQFRRYYEEAIRRSGDAGLNLLQILELRLDNAVFRLGLASSRDQARQMVTHGHITINGKKVNIPSYQVRIGEEIAVKLTSQKSKLFANAAEKMKALEPRSWLLLNTEKVGGKVLDKPKKDDIQPVFDIRSIIEFYSR